MSPASLVPEAVCPLADTFFVRLLEAEEPTDSLNENVTRDGCTLQCERHNIPMRDADGCVQGFVSIVQDVSDRRRAEEEL